MKFIIKYLLLIVISFGVSILIYNHFENLQVSNKDDTLVLKEKKENNFSVVLDYTIDNPNVILNPYGSSPLMALVVFKTKETISPVITIEGKNGSRNLVQTFAPSKTHVLPVYGLYPDYDNVLVIEAGSKTKKVNIKTDKLPDDFYIEENDKTDSSFNFVETLDGSYTAIRDENGEVRFYINGNYR